MYRVWLCLTSCIFLIGFCGANLCKDNNLCCQGRDSSCVIQKAQQNDVIENSTDKPCYCDHACMKLGDCCPDFQETCGVQDCIVSSWGEWTDCSSNCGSGSMERTRRVLQKQSNGGRHCPSLVQRRACREHSGCPKDSELPLREEAAMLLPGKLSASRHNNETVDVRKNLRMRNPDDPESNTDKAYCVRFRVSKVTKACRFGEYSNLRDGSMPCILCEGAALRRDLDWRCRGHGVQNHHTRFYSLTNPQCHGKWIRTSDKLERNLACCLKPDFIFV